MTPVRLCSSPSIVKLRRRRTFVRRNKPYLCPEPATERPRRADLHAEYIFTEIRNHKRAFAVGVIILLLAVTSFGYWFLKVRSSSEGSAPIGSIAVLPFQNKGGDADTDYLSDGLTESLIFRLSQLPGLKVSPTSSVIRYTGDNIDVAKIASELGVDSVMTGRLVKRGDNLNITVEARRYAE